MNTERSKRQIMMEKNAISGAEGECFITVGGNRKNFMSVKNLEAKASIKKKEVPVLGKPVAGHKGTGMTYSGKATAYYNTSIIREMLYKFQTDGILPYFDILVVNEDPSTDVGRQSLILVNCLLDEGILAKLDVAGDFLEEDISFTFDRFEMPSKFKPMPGM